MYLLQSSGGSECQRVDCVGVRNQRQEASVWHLLQWDELGKCDHQNVEEQCEHHKSLWLFHWQLAKEVLVVLTVCQLLRLEWLRLGLLCQPGNIFSRCHRLQRVGFLWNSLAQMQRHSMAGRKPVELSPTRFGVSLRGLLNETRVVFAWTVTSLRIGAKSTVVPANRVRFYCVCVCRLNLTTLKLWTWA